MEIDKIESHAESVGITLSHDVRIIEGTVMFTIVMPNGARREKEFENTADATDVITWIDDDAARFWKAKRAPAKKGAK
ncbi:MAG: hypothetical protein AAAC47_06845 [Pararhizobium sp.]